MVLSAGRMDTQEQYKFAFTKKMNWRGTHGCSKDNDRLFQLTDPKRISFHYPRSNHHHFLLSEKCKNLQDWEDTGYVPYNKNIQVPQNMADTNYFIVQDIDHACFNQFKKLFGSMKQMNLLDSYQLQIMFTKIVDICELNSLRTKLNWDNFTIDNKLCNLTLESAQIGLVKY